MSSPSQVAAGFTITGLLDGASRTRGRYPVSEIAVADIADHPANAAYSMDPAGIAELAESIREDGLTDLPLVRKVGDGSWQMVSGHRRKAAYALLAKDDPAYERMPCRVIEGIDDERAVTLLHAANYFTRALTVTERAAATEALRGDAVRLRSEDPSLSGMRVDDVKATIIERQTGRKVSGRVTLRLSRGLCTHRTLPPARSTSEESSVPTKPSASAASWADKTESMEKICGVCAAQYKLRGGVSTIREPSTILSVSMAGCPHTTPSTPGVSSSTEIALLMASVVMSGRAPSWMAT